MSDAIRKIVQVFDQSGNLVREIQEAVDPGGLAIAGGHLYVVDVGS